MKKIAMALILSAFPALTLTGCGGGGGATPAASVATTRVFLFGTMSSNSKIATVQTTMTVPMGVMVNYSSPPGATAGTFPLRSGFVVPSGPAQVLPTDFSGTFDLASRRLTVNLLNTPGNNQADLKSSSSDNGAEIATINFTLASAAGAPPTMPLEDPAVTVGQDKQTSSGHVVGNLSGCKINFVTTVK